MLFRQNVKLGIAAIGLFALSGAMLAPQVPVAAQTPGAPQANPHKMGRKGGERHPEIRRAVRALMNAQQFLQHASHDFAGHREKALDLVQRAIDESKLALQSDKN